LQGGPTAGNAGEARGRRPAYPQKNLHRPRLQVAHPRFPRRGPQMAWDSAPQRTCCASAERPVHPPRQLPVGACSRFICICRRDRHAQPTIFPPRCRGGGASAAANITQRRQSLCLPRLSWRARQGLPLTLEPHPGPIVDNMVGPGRIFRAIAGRQSTAKKATCTGPAGTKGRRIAAYFVPKKKPGLEKPSDPNDPGPPPAQFSAVSGQFRFLFSTK